MKRSRRYRILISLHYASLRLLLILPGSKAPQERKFLSSLACGYCLFSSGVYEVENSSSPFFEFCPAKGIDIHPNFIYEVQMTIVQGDMGGLLLCDSNNIPDC